MRNVQVMTRPRWGLLAPDLLSWSGARAGARFTDIPLTYHVRNADGATVTLTMPRIVTGDKTVAARINAVLHRVLLDIPPPDDGDPATPRLIEADTPLQAIIPDGVRRMNGGRTLSVFVTTEGCGAYCVTQALQIDFDPRTGRALTDKDIVTPRGRAILGAWAIKARALRLRREIARLSKPGARAGGHDAADLALQKAMYAACLKERYTPGGGMYAYYRDSPGVMTIQEGALGFSVGACANHAMRALDDLGDHDLTYKARRSRPWLTAYGRYLLPGEGAAP